jgi:hypothetical protein
MALAHVLIQKSPGATEEYCLQLETTFQRQLIGTWNQMAAAGRNYGWKLPYFTRRSQ